mgnify:CR=1 FL=1
MTSTPVLSALAARDRHHSALHSTAQGLSGYRTGMADPEHPQKPDTKIITGGRRKALTGVDADRLLDVYKTAHPRA